MHIVVIPSWYSNDDNVVLGSFFKEQALALKESGAEVTVCYNETIPIYDYRKFKNIFNKKVNLNFEGGLDTYRYTDFNYLMQYHKRFLVFKTRIEKLINRVIKDKGKIDIIHFHSCFWAGVCMPYIRNNFKIPCVITEHTSIDNSKKIRTSYMKYILRAYREADALISVSNSLKNEILKLVNRKIEVINNFIDGDLFNVRNSFVKNSKFTFFSLAFLVEGKGFELLIDACEILKNKGYDFILEIGGDGKLRNKLQDIVNTKKLNDNIKFLGLLNREEVVLRMNKCDSFILTSRYETFGVVYIEALACGKPIIAIDNGGIRDIISDKVGILIKQYDCEKISKSMEFMINNIEIYDGGYIRNYFLERFEKRAIIAKLKDVYKNCLAI